jgi:SAM-dependent methyltransferase
LGIAWGNFALKSAGKRYEKIYGKLCGLHPHLRPWHFQWMALKDLRADLKRILPSLNGKVLDVGCGDKPYQGWFGRLEKYVGVDVGKHSKADVVVDSLGPWPFKQNVFDVVLCTQVFEHVPKLEETIQNIQEAVKPGGTLVVTVPFIYNEHGSPEDYRRFSVHGMKILMAEMFEIVEVKVLGGIGSTVGILCLNWVEVVTSRYKALRFVRGILLPLWMMVCFVVNGIGCLVDKIDHTQAFYNNVLLVARKASD